jgi:hypothetical protein
MKKLVILAAFAASLVTGSLRADPAARLAAFNKATGNGSNLLAITFGGALGSWTNMLKELAAAGWTDDAVIATRSLHLIGWTAAADGGMSEEFAKKLAASLTGAPDGVVLASQTFGAVPVAYRQPFEALYKEVVKSHYPERPVRSALMCDKAMTFTGNPLSHWVTAGYAAVLSKATVEELVALRLAPELRATDEAALILDKATAAAKKQLRKEGKSFVIYTEVIGGVTNVVNPLAIKLAPVVDALNAPLMVGIESALAACGLTVTNQDANRMAMSVLAVKWQDAILDGEVEPALQAPYLAALKVRLGVKEYNQFVDVYNNGAPK